MPEEKIEISLDLQGAAQVVQGLQSVASVLGSFGGGGAGGGGFGTVLLQAGRLGLAVGIAAVAMKALGDAARTASQTLTEFTQTQFGLAAGAQTTALLRTVGRALGVGDISALAQSIHGATLTPLGAAAAGRFGIPFRPYEIGSATDRGEMVMRVIEGLRATARTEGLGGATAQARNLGAESLLPLTLVSDESLQRLREHSQLMAQLFGSDRLRAAAEFNLSMAILGDTFDALKSALLFSLIPAIDFLNTQLATPALRLLARLGGATEEQINAALNSQTRELRRNTQELQKLNGIYGGGSSVRGAIPGAFGIGAGYALGEALRAGHIRFGAYSVNF